MVLVLFMVLSLVVLNVVEFDCAMQARCASEWFDAYWTIFLLFVASDWDVAQMNHSLARRACEPLACASGLYLYLSWPRLVHQQFDFVADGDLTCRHDAASQTAVASHGVVAAGAQSNLHL